VVTPRGAVAVPRHKGDLPTGTRHSILKAFLQLGLTLLLMACVLSLYAQVALVGR